MLKIFENKRLVLFFALILIAIIILGSITLLKNVEKDELTDKDIEKLATKYKLNPERGESVINNKVKMLEVVKSGKIKECDNLKDYDDECFAYTTIVGIIHIDDCSEFKDVPDHYNYCNAVKNSDIEPCSNIKDEDIMYSCMYFAPRLMKAYSTKDGSICELTSEEVEFDPENDPGSFSPRSVCYLVSEM